MEEKEKSDEMKQIVLGILAHVDAGKTTLSESMLYCAGSIRKMGRVDHRDSFLDFDVQERDRGITIFSKQAVLTWKDSEFSLLDTPGHVDFSAEMERTLQVLDAALIVINAQDGVQVHTETIWNLLEHYKIPVFLFINKMDISFHSKEKLMEDIRKKCSVNCVDFSDDPQKLQERIALCDEELLEEYLENHKLCAEQIQDAVLHRKVFPCVFGSALRMTNVELLMDVLDRLLKQRMYPLEFGARVYKISRDEQGNRLTHVKITGGTLKAKQKLSSEEKIDQIRRYSGSRYQMIETAEAGMIVALKGLRGFEAGDGMGAEQNRTQPMIASFMEYRVILPKQANLHEMVEKLNQLCEEDPELHVFYHAPSKQIRLRLMGEIQIEVLKKIIEQRTGVLIELDQGNVLYKETIEQKVIGVGHFEPLRHYAEVHLRLEPLKAGSGLRFACDCSQDVLAKNWQNLILTHLKEKEHVGVLTGSSITDMKITLIGGRTHPKHTEGGDFREATYRAVRQGLKMAKSILLEPFYRFRIELPSEYVSRTLYDVEAMAGDFTLESADESSSRIVGRAPVAKMQNYQLELSAYTKGKGKLFCTMDGYYPCVDQQKIIEQIGYDSERDLENPTFSIFCAHGSGFAVSWDHVYEYMHIKDSLQRSASSITRHQSVKIEEEELQRVFSQMSGRNRKEKAKPLKSAAAPEEEKILTVAPRLEEILIVDGYNILYSWSELKELASESLDAARDRLIEWMSSYQGYKNCPLILVFDAYKVKENEGTIINNGSIYIVYTKHAQTADSYIEKAAHELGGKYRITVATSDGMEQLIIMGQGARRMSARELELDFKSVHHEAMKQQALNGKKANRPLAELKALASASDE